MVIRIGTWNLENLFKPPNPFAPKTEEEYQAKLDALASAITRMDPDVLAVHEVGDPVAPPTLGCPGRCSIRGTDSRAASGHESAKMPSARSGAGWPIRCSTGQRKDEVGSARGQGTDLGQLADVPCLDGADRVDRHQDPVVVFAAVINRRARTVREVAASDDNCVHTQIGEMRV
jgi:hypothetical protein